MPAIMMQKDEYGIDSHRLFEFHDDWPEPDRIFLNVILHLYLRDSRINRSYINGDALI